MSDEVKMPSVIIKPQDQSAPREHWADREIKKAAEEIDSGRYVAEISEEHEAMESLGLALGAGTGGVAIGERPALEEFRQTQEMNRLGRHPRVVEAMERMAKEVEAAKGHEQIEKNIALRELVMASEEKNRWDGQGRWMGDENEESRYGEILSPQQFYDRLGKVTGKGRLKLSENVMFPFEGARSGLSGVYMRNPLWDGAAERYRAGEREEALRMADQAQKMLVEARKLEKLGRTDQAQKKTREIAAMVAEAREKFDGASSGTSLAEPEFVRVATVQWPLMTEWMIMQFSEWGTVWKPKHYGWRTSLLTMIRCGAITEAQAHKAFPVGTGPATEWYLQQIFDFKLDGGVTQ